jgi:flagellar basal-body rod protein FlgB
MAIDSIIFDEGSRITNKLMELSMERQKVIANNIANVNTPGYIRKDVDFQKQLKNVIESGDVDRLGEVKGKMIEDHDDAPRLDGNNIVIPNEMNEMMQNSVLYNLLSRAFNTRMNIIKSAIRSN